MSKTTKAIDTRIESIGYKIRMADLLACYIVYENEKDDKEVIIEWDDDEEYCLIFSQTISRLKDWTGNTYQMPTALSIQEAGVFIEKINEMRTES